MELNSSTSNVLKNLSEEDDITDQEFAKFISHIFDSFSVNLNNGCFEANTNDEKLLPKKTNIESKELVAATFMLITELARNNSDKISAGVLLEELGFSPSRIKIFTDNYEKKLKTLRLFLSCVSDSLPHVVDANWRLDYCIKESNQERLNEPIFIVELKVQRPHQDGLSTIKFLCNIEQLQDLVYKLKEATKSIEKLAQ